jgi:hypothetical protein
MNRRCGDLDILLLQRELGLLAAAEVGELGRHLTDCDGCATRARQAAVISAGLRSLRRDYPFEIDVTARVAARVAGPYRTEPASVAELAWASAVAVAGAIAALLALPWLLAPLGSVLETLWLFGSATRGCVRPLLALIEVPLRLLWACAETLVQLAPGLRPWRAVLETAAVWTGIVMSITTLSVIVRDARWRPHRLNRGDAP